ncbi:hypothetical protein OQJ13_02690 [Legionella sp. PATHC035]|uniref:hypothetical protein n=1 Tax=Legionella sp. PATHC035 TaxID=2992040 RepID=UPI0022434878|nr:hypothetical protein [Legionella sp. PATHC035]MCW8407875.1 hypothetical protein [Legionella sp. PATHC035]
MAYSKRFFIDPSNKKMTLIHESLCNEFEKDIAHIESSYDELLNNTTDIELSKKMNEIKIKINHILTKFTFLFFKNQGDLFKAISQLKMDILQLKTQFMMQYLLINCDHFSIDDFVLVTGGLHNCLEEFGDKLLQNMDGVDAASRQKYFDEEYSLLQERYEVLLDIFSIGDSRSYENTSTSECSADEEYSDDSSRPLTF